MPRFLLQASYTHLGVVGLVQNPENRASVINALVESLGGKVETIDYCFGDHDVVTIIEMPDEKSVAAFSMAIAASGAVTNIKTTVLMTIADGAEAAARAGEVSYRPPGR